MRIAGIIAEYNPFHAGHAWQISALRLRGFDAVVCVCSPGVVQRGSVAAFPTPVRTAAALAGGADLVLSLPAPYALLSAQGFAQAGVQLLTALGVCEVIAFGTEIADTNLLQKTAEALQTECYAAALQQHLQEGKAFACARSLACEAVLPGSATVLATPNNNLAVEYCVALQQLRQSGAAHVPQALCLPRMGTPHDAPLDLAAGGFASATALRGLLAESAQPLQDYVPPACMPLYSEAADAGRVLCAQSFSVAVLSRLRALPQVRFANIRGAGEGLENRVYTAMRTAATVQEVYDAAKTKRYAHARVRRFVLDAALGYQSDLPKTPPYLHVLGSSDNGQRVLRLAKLYATLPISASLRSLEQKNQHAAIIASAHAAAEDFAALCMRVPQPCGSAYTTKYCSK